MSVQESDIEKVAALARIDIAAEQMPEVTGRINDILSMVDQMQAVDTSAIKPMANPHDAVQRLRADTVSESDQRQALQANAPLTEDGLFLVPKVID